MKQLEEGADMHRAYFCRQHHGVGDCRVRPWKPCLAGSGCPTGVTGSASRRRLFEAVVCIKTRLASQQYHIKTVITAIVIFSIVILFVIVAVTVAVIVTVTVMAT